MAHSKRYNNNFEKINREKEYSLEEAAELLTSLSLPKFDESIEVAINLGVDPKHADQIVRGTVALPNGIGKDIKVLVFAKDNLCSISKYAEGSSISIRSDSCDSANAIAVLCSSPPDKVFTFFCNKCFSSKGLVINAS